MDEEPSLYRILKQWKRQDSRTVDGIYDSEGNFQTSPSNILRTFTEFMKKKYDAIQVPTTVTCKTVPQVANYTFDEPIIMDEPHLAVKQGKKLKAPDYVGIGSDFFTSHGKQLNKTCSP